MQTIFLPLPTVLFQKESLKLILNDNWIEEINWIDSSVSADITAQKTLEFLSCWERVPTPTPATSLDQTLY